MQKQRLEFFIEMDSIPTTTHQQKGFNRNTGRWYEPAKLRFARRLYLLALGQYKPKKPLIAPLSLEVVFCFPCTKKSKHRERKITRPDLDNMHKLLQDCMGELNFFEDDARISDLKLSKRYSDNVGIKVILTELEEIDETL